MMTILKKNLNQEKWSKHYKSINKISYPAEGIIRIFLGKYPKLNFKCTAKQKILDLGYGDGRHLIFFKKLNLNVHGVEISDEINLLTKKNFNKIKISNITLKKGDNEKIPFKNSYFHHLVSWNSCYYMKNNRSKFEDHINEMARVLRKSGFLILSIPKSNCFIFKNSKIYKKKYRIIKSDYFKKRNGQVMRYFENVKEIKSDFSKLFKNIFISEIDMDWFGLKYSWHIIIAQKK
jgi:ubiquinone/menaquinone biosynthesis C-methylase UbiE